MSLTETLSGKPGTLPRGEVKDATDRVERFAEPNGGWDPKEVERRRRVGAMRVNGGGFRDVPVYPRSTYARTGNGS